MLSLNSQPPISPPSSDQPTSGQSQGATPPNFLVRRRTFFTLVVPLALIILAKPIFLWLPWGTALVLTGESLRVWAAGYLVKAKELTTAGPFAYVRHPLYLGSLLIAVGYCFLSGRLLAFPLVLSLYCLFFFAAILHEERLLEKTFGLRYRQYKEQTGRLWPFLKSARQRQGHFSWQRVAFNQEPIVALETLIFLLLFWLKKLWIG